MREGKGGGGGKSASQREGEREKERDGERKEDIICAIPSHVHHVAVCSFVEAAVTMEQSQSKSA